MTSVNDQVAGELQALATEGSGMLEMIKSKDLPTFALHYHLWYTRALSVIRQLLPDREMEFRRLYERDSGRKRFDSETYTLEDYVQALVSPGSRLFGDAFDIHSAAGWKFFSQLMILKSAGSRLSDILAKIRGVLQADLFDSQLDAARHLMNNGHLRAAGAVAGVVLESHLSQVCSQRSVAIRKKAPHISDFNDALKNAGVFDVVQWRRVQGLADIRNLCDHKKDRDPTRDEVDELISGVDKAIKTLA